MNMLMNAPGSTNTNGLPVSPAGRLRQQRLAGAGRAVEQYPAGGVAADVLDGFGVLEEDQVLAHPLLHRILAPNVVEAGVDVVGEVGLHPAARQEPEQQHELADQKQRVDDSGGPPTAASC